MSKPIDELRAIVVEMWDVMPSACGDWAIRIQSAINDLSDQNDDLRDKFAGQALAGYFAHPSTPHMNATDAGAYCYAMADAMLVARKAKP